MTPCEPHHRGNGWPFIDGGLVQQITERGRNRRKTACPFFFHRSTGHRRRLLPREMDQIYTKCFINQGTKMRPFLQLMIILWFNDRPWFWAFNRVGRRRRAERPPGFPVQYAKRVVGAAGIDGGGPIDTSSASRSTAGGVNLYRSYFADVTACGFPQTAESVAFVPEQSISGWHWLEAIKKLGSPALHTFCHCADSLSSAFFFTLSIHPSNRMTAAGHYAQVQSTGGGIVIPGIRPGRIQPSLLL